MARTAGGRSAFTDIAAGLAGSARRLHRLVVRAQAAAIWRCDARALQRDISGSGEQVLLRLVQRKRVGTAGARTWRRAVARRRSGGNRWRVRQWFGRRGGS